MASELSLRSGYAMYPRSRQQQGAVMSKELVRTACLVPDNLRHAAAADNPIIHVLYNIFQRLKLQSGTKFENLVTLVALHKIVSPAWRGLRTLFLRFFASQVTISEYDPTAQEVLRWMSSKTFEAGFHTKAVITAAGQQDLGSSYHARHLGVKERFTQRLCTMFGYNYTPVQESIGSVRVQCLPPVGFKLFWVGYRPFLYHRSDGKQVAVQPTNREHGSVPAPASITLYTPGWSLRPLLSFVGKCHEYSVRNMVNTMAIHYASGSQWSYIVKSKRNLDTVDLDEKLKTRLVKDAVYYCSEECQKFHSDCGIPYRRGYLFCGPPGTGKTSFSAALAGHLDCDLYIISLSSSGISDESLRVLFMSLPTTCVVVIEDIDSCGIGREQASTTAASRSRNMLSLSGVLNAIDGNAAAEGRLLIMTSNNPKSLDKALTRPGRVDLAVQFGKMKYPAIRAMFKRLVGRAAIAKKGLSEGHIDDYSELFARQVPPDTFTPAQLENFLLWCRGDPNKAVAEIDAWVKARRAPANPPVMSVPAEQARNGETTPNDETTLDAEETPDDKNTSNNETTSNEEQTSNGEETSNGEATSLFSCGDE